MDFSNKFVQITPQVGIKVTHKDIMVETLFSLKTALFFGAGASFDHERRAWRFPKMADSFTFLDELFGIDWHGENNPTTKVRVGNEYLEKDFEEDGCCAAMLGGYLLAMRSNPNWNVRLGKGVKLLSGGFNQSGNRLYPKSDTVVEIEVTTRMAERLGLLKVHQLANFTDHELLDEMARRGFDVGQWQ